MVEIALRSGRLDRWAIGLSGLCLVHCVISVIFIATVASAGGLFLDPLIHEVGLALAVVIGVVALGWGFREHGRIGPLAVGAFGLLMMVAALIYGHGLWEIPMTMVGVSFIALGHILNRKAAR